MIHLALTVLASLTISLILKVNENRGGNRLVVAGTNYVVAALLALLLAGRDLSAPTWGTAGTGALIGAGFVAGFLVLMRAISSIGLAVPVSAARLSTLVPVTGSILFFDEVPTALQLVGIGVGLLSFIVLALAQRRSDSRGFDPAAIGLLALVFLVIGAVDFSMKIVHESGLEQGEILFWVFGSAAFLCWIAVAITSTRPRMSELGLGAALGVPNYFASHFLLLALRDLPAAVVFPVVSAGGVVAVTLAAILIWKERPNPAGWLGIALATAAVLILGLEQ